MLHYLRSVLQQSFFKLKSFTALSGRKILLTRPKLLKYELYVFQFYRDILTIYSEYLERETTFEQDLALYEKSDDF